MAAPRPALLEGDVHDARAHLTISPAAQVMGTVLVGDPGLLHELTMTNDGTVASGPLGVVRFEGNASDFEVVPDPADCQPTTTLAPAAARSAPVDRSRGTTRSNDTIVAASLEPADCSARTVVGALDAYVAVTPSATQQAQITTNSLDTQVTLVPCP